MHVKKKISLLTKHRYSLLGSLESSIKIFLSIGTVSVWAISIMIIDNSIVQVLATLAYISRGDLKRTRRHVDCANVDFGRVATAWS